MKIEVKKTVTKKVEETVELNLVKYWVIRVIQGVESKKCVAEREFGFKPEEQEVASVLAEFGNKKVFATIEENYRLEEMPKDE